MRVLVCAAALLLAAGVARGQSPAAAGLRSPNGGFCALEGFGSLPHANSDVCLGPAGLGPGSFCPVRAWRRWGQLSQQVGAVPASNQPGEGQLVSRTTWHRATPGETFIKQPASASSGGVCAGAAKVSNMYSLSTTNEQQAARVPGAAGQGWVRHHAAHQHPESAGTQ